MVCRGVAMGGLSERRRGRRPEIPGTALLSVVLAVIGPPDVQVKPEFRIPTNAMAFWAFFGTTLDSLIDNAYPFGKLLAAGLFHAKPPSFYNRHDPQNAA